MSRSHRQRFPTLDQLLAARAEAALDTLALPQRLRARGRELYVSSRAKATMAGYRTAWRSFTAWCAGYGLDPLSFEDPPQLVACYLAEHAGRLKLATLTTYTAGISYAYGLLGTRSVLRATPVRQVLSGIARVYGGRQLCKAAFVSEDVIAVTALLADAPNRVLAIRDAAALTMLFVSAMRRREAAALDIDNILMTDRGYVITIERSKTDQRGRGTELGVTAGTNPTTCPLRAMRLWLEVLCSQGITSGPLFRKVSKTGRIHGGRVNPQIFAQIVKRAAILLGRDPDAYGGHSTRAGMVTSAGQRAIPDSLAMAQTRHKTFRTFVSYNRAEDLLSLDLTKKLGL